MRYFLYILTILSITVSCSEEYTPKPQKEKNYPVVLGELSQNKSVSILLNNARNITETTPPPHKILFSKVELLDNAKKPITKLVQKENNRWESDFTTQEDNTYYLQFNWNNKTITIETTVPPACIAEITKKQGNPVDSLSLNITISTSAHLENYFYIIECWQHYKRLPFDSNSSISDNYKYGELTAPYHRLFVKTQKKQQEIEITIAKNLIAENSAEIRIKSVTPKFYNYLYHKELQEQDDNFFLPKLNTEYLGVLGGSYTLSLKL